MEKILLTISSKSTLFYVPPNDPFKMTSLKECEQFCPKNERCIFAIHNMLTTYSAKMTRSLEGFKKKNPLSKSHFAQKKWREKNAKAAHPGFLLIPGIPAPCRGPGRVQGTTFGVSILDSKKFGASRRKKKPKMAKTPPPTWGHLWGGGVRLTHPPYPPRSRVKKQNLPCAKCIFPPSLRKHP